MKVKRKKFTPIIITIENEIEAEILWNKLNCPVATSYEDYYKVHETYCIEDLYMHASMFKKFNKVYNPKTG